MQRRCAACGVGFEAHRSDARFCSTKCANEGQEGGQSKPAQLEVVVLAELEGLRMVDTSLGQQALELARRMSSLTETGSAAAGISRELREVMSAAASARPATADPVDELRRRKEAKVASGSPGVRHSRPRRQDARAGGR